MTASVIRVIDIAPDLKTHVVGRFYPEHKTYVPEENAPTRTTSDANDSDEAVEDRVKAKVVRRGRRPQPKTTEGVETK